MSNQPHRLDQHREKARRAQELCFARVEIADALRWTRQQINGLEQQYMGDKGKGRMRRHDLNSSFPYYVVVFFRYRLEEDGGHDFLYRGWGDDPYEFQRDNPT